MSYREISDYRITFCLGLAVSLLSPICQLGLIFESVFFFSGVTECSSLLVFLFPKRGILFRIFGASVGEASL